MYLEDRSKDVHSFYAESGAAINPGSAHQPSLPLSPSHRLSPAFPPSTRNLIIP